MEKNKYITKEKFAQLKYHVCYGNTEGVDVFFKENIVNLKAKEELMNHIRNDSFFFSFRLDSMNKMEYIKNLKKRYQSVFKYFSTSEQITIIHSILLDWGKDYMDIIKIIGEDFKESWGKNNKNNKINEKEILIMASKFLYKQDYNSLLSLKEKIPTLLELSSSVAPIHYGSTYSTGCFYICAEDKLYQLKDNLILNYKKENVEFFKSMDWYMEKDEIKINNLEEIIKALIEKNNYVRFENDYNLEKNVKNYKSFVLSDILDKRLSRVEKPMRNFKI